MPEHSEPTSGQAMFRRPVVSASEPLLEVFASYPLIECLMLCGWQAAFHCPQPAPLRSEKPRPTVTTFCRS
jgi:hypothetical protein